MHSDAAFRKEQKEGVDAGRALRGAVFLRPGAEPQGSKPNYIGVRPCHLLDWQYGAPKTVTRSTFTSELMAAMSSADRGLALAATLAEMVSGLRGPRQLAASVMANSRWTSRSSCASTQWALSRRLRPHGLSRQQNTPCCHACRGCETSCAQASLVV